MKILPVASDVRSDKLGFCDLCLEKGFNTFSYREARLKGTNKWANLCAHHLIKFGDTTGLGDTIIDINLPGVKNERT